MRSDPTAHLIRFQQLFFGTVLIGLAIAATTALLSGGALIAELLVTVIIATTTILLLGNKYWMLWPMGFWGRYLLNPGLFDLPELVCLAVIATHFVRKALRPGIREGFRPQLIWAIPYFAWAFTIYCVNPPGFMLLGSQVIGGRFYFRMAIAFGVMLVLATRTVEEQDCHRLFQAAILLAVCSLVRRVLGVSLADGGCAITAYEYLGAATLYYWLFARYRLRSVLSSAWKPLLVAFLVAATLYSGKRRVALNIGMFPLIRALIARQDRRLALVISGLGIVAMLLVVAGQGRLYDLPLSMQRGISFLPGGVWDTRIRPYAHGQDLFREQVHRHARQIVAYSPWLGRKGFAIDLDELLWANRQQHDATHFGHAVASNWHNTWIGMAADFGLPAAISWAVFSVGFLIVGVRIARACPDGSYRQTLSLFIVADFVLALLASHTSGHSALVPFNTWPAFGLLLSLAPQKDIEYAKALDGIYIARQAAVTSG